MTSLTAREVADQVGTDPKTLRRFLRADVTYNNPGSGGRYVFKESDVPTIKKRFDAWCKNNPPRGTTNGAIQTKPVKVRKVRVRDTECKTVEEAAEHPELAYEGIIPPRLSQAERVAANARVDRLEAALKARGLHISQINDRDFRRIPA